MKYIKKFHKLFEEIGTYRYEIHHGDYEIWDDNENHFLVQLIQGGHNSMNQVELVWKVEDELGNWVYDVVTKKYEDEDVNDISRPFISRYKPTNIFKLLKTIFSVILPDFLNKHNWCNRVLIKGREKEDHKDNGVLTKRTMIYHRYLVSNPLPNWEISIEGNSITLTKNNVIN